MVLPSSATSRAPYDQRIEYSVLTESVVWLMAKPTGWPSFFSFCPARSRSSHVSGARQELRGELGRHLNALDVVEADRRAGELREPLAQLGELHVRGGGIVHRGEERQLSGRPRCRRLPCE